MKIPNLGPHPYEYHERCVEGCVKMLQQQLDDLYQELLARGMADPGYRFEITTQKVATEGE